MITQLGNVKLRTGEKMIARCIEPPEEKYREKLTKFLIPMVGENSWFRDVKERLKGNYAEFCTDRYFIGEIGGSIVAQSWYGLPRG